MKARLLTIRLSYWGTVFGILCLTGFEAQSNQTACALQLEEAAQMAYDIGVIKARRMQLSSDAQEEVGQNTALAFLQSHSRYDSSRSLSAYLSGLANHKAIDFIRKKRARPSDPELLDQRAVQTKPLRHRLGPVDQSPLISTIQQLLSVGVNDGDAIRRRRFHVMRLWLRGMRNKDIAEHLDLSNSKVDIAVHKIKAELETHAFEAGLISSGERVNWRNLRNDLVFKEDNVPVRKAVAVEDAVLHLTHSVLGKGTNISLKNRGPKVSNPAQKKAVRTLWSQGKTLSEIMKATGFTKAQVKAVLAPMKRKLRMQVVERMPSISESEIDFLLANHDRTAEFRRILEHPDTLTAFGKLKKLVAQATEDLARDPGNKWSNKIRKGNNWVIGLLLERKSPTQIAKEGAHTRVIARSKNELVEQATKQFEEEGFRLPRSQIAFLVDNYFQREALEALFRNSANSRRQLAVLKADLETHGSPLIKDALKRETSFAKTAKSHGKRPMAVSRELDKIRSRVLDAFPETDLATLNLMIDNSHRWDDLKALLEEPDFLEKGYEQTPTLFTAAAKQLRENAPPTSLGKSVRTAWETKNEARKRYISGERIADIQAELGPLTTTAIAIGELRDRTRELVRREKLPLQETQVDLLLSHLRHWEQIRGLFSTPLGRRKIELLDNTLSHHIASGDEGYPVAVTLVQRSSDQLVDQLVARVMIKELDTNEAEATGTLPHNGINLKKRLPRIDSMLYEILIAFGVRDIPKKDTLKEALKLIKQVDKPYRDRQRRENAYQAFGEGESPESIAARVGRPVSEINQWIKEESN